MSNLLQLPAELMRAVLLLCVSPIDNKCFPPLQPPLAPHCLWGAVDAMLTITAIAGTCKTLQATITDEVWAAAMVVGLPLYAGAKASASHWGMVKRQMLHALANRPSAPPVQDVDGVGGVWALLDIHDACRSPWMAPKAAIKHFHSTLVVDLPVTQAKRDFRLTDGELLNLVPKLVFHYVPVTFTNSLGQRAMEVKRYDYTQVLRVARAKHLGQGTVKLTPKKLRDACTALDLPTGSVPQMKLRLHEAVDLYGSPETAEEREEYWYATSVYPGMEAIEHFGNVVGVTKTEALGHPSITEDDFTFLAAHESRNPRYAYAARMLLYQQRDLRRVVARKRLGGKTVIRKRALKALCDALGVPTATNGHSATLVDGKWSGSSAITKQQMMIRARLAIDPNGRITRRRWRV